MAAASNAAADSGGSGGGSRCLFSPSCDLLGVCRPDGVLQVLDARVATVRGEVAPAKHLLAACTCLAWRPNEEDSGDSKKSPSKKKSRKRKSSLSTPVNGDSASATTFAETSSPSSSSELAVGTASGSVVVYSAKTGDCKERPVHEDAVTGLAWGGDGDGGGAVVHSVSQDGCVGTLHVRKGTSSKFRPGGGGGGAGKRRPLFSVALLRDGSNGLLAGTFSRVLWVDLDARAVLREFGGHVGAVSALAALPPSPRNPAPLAVSAGASEKDRAVSVWRLDEVERPEALLNVNETAESVVISESGEEGGGNVLVGTVSRTGVFRCFELDAAAAGGGGRRKKTRTIKPKVTVQVASSKDAGGRVASLPVLSARFSPSPSAATLHLAHGSHARPAFESLEYESLDKTTCLVREPKTAQPTADLGIKFMNPEKSGATVLAPGATMLAKASLSGGQKRKAEGGKMDQLPMLDRLRLLSKDAEHVTTPPRTDTLMQLLLQGLHNRDEKILNSVLDRADEELIDKTVRKLPVEGVVPLIEELQSYIRGRGTVNLSHSKWLRSVLQHHSGYLSSLPQCPELLGPVHAMLEARTRSYAPLMRLKGKLDIMTRQIESSSSSSGPAAGDDGEGLASKEALLVYQDDSSDELSDVLDDLLLPASDNEESWNMEGDEEEEEEEEEEEDDDKGMEEDEEEEDSSEEEEEGGQVMVNGMNGGDSDDSMESD